MPGCGADVVLSSALSSFSFRVLRSSSHLCIVPLPKISTPCCKSVPGFYSACAAGDLSKAACCLKVQQYVLVAVHDTLFIVRAGQTSSALEVKLAMVLLLVEAVVDDTVE